MAKMHIDGRSNKKHANGTRLGAKNTSHGTYRCQRKPNSPRCKNKA